VELWGGPARCIFSENRLFLVWDRGPTDWSCGAAVRRFRQRWPQGTCSSPTATYRRPHDLPDLHRPFDREPAEYCAECPGARPDRQLHVFRNNATSTFFTTILGTGIGGSGFSNVSAGVMRISTTTATLDPRVNHHERPPRRSTAIRGHKASQLPSGCRCGEPVGHHRRDRRQGQRSPRKATDQLLERCPTRGIPIVRWIPGAPCTFGPRHGTKGPILSGHLAPESPRPNSCSANVLA